MLDTHITHATATFSELGIATASILIADIPKWREIVHVGQADPIDVENLAVMARKIGGLYYLLNCIAKNFPRDGILFAAPFFSFALGCYALVGISHYPTIITNHLSFLAYDIATLNQVYWWMALTSFIFAMLCAVVERSKVKVFHEANQITKTDIG